jgi:type IV conjugative transfer system lipoprotein TraV
MYQVMIKITKLAVLAMSFSLVTACGVHKGSFDCPNNKGMGCKGMIDVYQKIHEKPSNIRMNTQVVTESNLVASQPTDLLAVNKNLEDKNSAPKSIYRTKDKIVRIWFNGYFDEENNYRDSQYVYSIISPAKWVVR